jgi:hypothetical protein
MSFISFSSYSSSSYPKIFVFFRMLCNHHNSSSIRVGESGKPGRGSIGRWIPFFVEFVMNLQVVQFYFAPRIWLLQSSPAVG